MPDLRGVIDDDDGGGDVEVQDVLKIMNFVVQVQVQVQIQGSSFIIHPGHFRRLLFLFLVGCLARGSAEPRALGLDRMAIKAWQQKPSKQEEQVFSHH